MWAEQGEEQWTARPERSAPVRARAGGLVDHSQPRSSRDRAELRDVDCRGPTQPARDHGTRSHIRRAVTGVAATGCAVTQDLPSQDVPVRRRRQPPSAERTPPLAHAALGMPSSRGSSMPSRGRVRSSSLFLTSSDFVPILDLVRSSSLLLTSSDLVPIPDLVRSRPCSRSRQISSLFLNFSSSWHVPHDCGHSESIELHAQHGRWGV